MENTLFIIIFKVAKPHQMTFQQLLFSIFLLAAPFLALGQHTFSIVAVDSSTGKVGSAGATCLQDTGSSTSSAVIISDVHPGRGVIHTQAAYLSPNQQTASDRMDMGESPEEIIDYVTENDYVLQGDSTIRQYGIADFDSTGSPRAAAFTGDSTLDYKDHIVGPNYAIQGNILKGPGVLDSMEARFLGTKGSLADKLMAALQGAKRPGADSRCLDEGVSSQSAFLRVAKPSDKSDGPSLDLVVPSTPYGREPIDSLACLYRQSQGKSCNVSPPDDTSDTTTTLSSRPSSTQNAKIIPNPVKEQAQLRVPAATSSDPLTVRIINATGKEVLRQTSNRSRISFSTSRLKQGLYFYTVNGNNGRIASGIFTVHP